MRLTQIIERHWYHTINPLLALILWPLSWLFGSVAFLRRLLFQLNFKEQTRLRVPVVVIGNLSVGGAGKTPLTKALATEFSHRGYHIGIILRGYKGSNTQARIVAATDSSGEVGDEALIYAQAGFKVAIGHKRVAAGNVLLQHYPTIQLILADDGLQHYYLQRDYEICVVDSSRGFGNSQLLPMGPLREPLRRLNSVDAIVVNGSANQLQLTQLFKAYAKPVYWQELEFVHFYNPVTLQIASVAELAGQKLCVMAAIGNPQRFFTYLTQLGLAQFTPLAYPDHYHYQISDIPTGCAIITTEKDYTKLAQFKHPNMWIAVVKARLNSTDLVNHIIDLITKGNR
jgi:tetraacyldisaccharide 4'-kinase